MDVENLSDNEKPTRVSGTLIICVVAASNAPSVVCPERRTRDRASENEMS